jgi:DNA repair protein SbcD/Mre11
VRLLHTSDWHFGKRLHGVELLEAQESFVDWLVTVVRDERIDVVLVAGDLYDRSTPAVDAVRIFDQAISKLAATGVPLVMISGNHDSGPRVGTYATLLESASVHVATDPAAICAPVVLTDEHGEVVIYPLPYLDPTLTRDTLEAASATHTDVLNAAMTRVRADLAGRPGARSVVVAHAFVAGGLSSESERDVSVGGAAVVPVTTFDGINYTALGHLHGPQNMSDNVRYSGSPLAYSFSEAGHTKSVTIVDLVADGSVGVTTIDTPVPRMLVTLTGTLDDLCSNDAHAVHEQAWVRAIITDPLLPTGPMDKLRQRFPHALHLEHRPDRTLDAAPEGRAERLEGLDDLAVMVEFFTEQVGVAPSDAERAVFAEAVDAARAAEVASS